MIKTKFNVEGMTCAACQAHVQSAVEKLNGVVGVNVNLLQNTMYVDYDPTLINADDISRAVEKSGYRAYPEKDAAKPHIQKKSTDLAKLIASIILLLALMYFSMGNMMWGFPAPAFADHEKNPIGFALLQLILVAPIIIIYGNYFISGFKKLFRGKPNMDSLIAIGASASIIYGIFALFMMSYAQSQIVGGDLKWQSALETYRHSLYFESAGMILTLVSLGKYLEGLSKKKTTAAITKLMDMAPKRAVVVRDGKELEIAAEEVSVGDTLIVKNGERVPVDGIVIEGSASIDQSNITGESMPQQKQIGDEVFSSTVVTAGYFKMRANKVGEDTSIAAIIKLVDEASNSKAPISKLADKISGVFVPVILAIALITLVANWIASSDFELALNFAITVVVIACPCALGLATPVAIMAGTGKGAQNGLLIKNAEILEKAHLIRTVVLDKTGTVTQGKPSVVDFDGTKNVMDEIYSLESMSEHPLAHAICQYAAERGAVAKEVKEFRSLEGTGIQGKINGILYGIGNLRFANDEELPVLTERFRKFAKEGKTPIAVYKDGAVVAVLALKDEVKQNSAAAVAELVKRGIKVVMLTGDNKATAEAIAKEVGVSEVIAEVYPSDKQQVINSLKTDEKHLVAMVGDGVNDAPALAAADIGIAIGGGSDVAMETSDIVLLRNDLMDVLNVIGLSKRVLRTIKLGLFWAFFYNFVCVVFATGAFYYLNEKLRINPMIGALAMSISSVSVVLNALTINLFKVKKAPQNTQNDGGDAQITGTTEQAFSNVTTDQPDDKHADTIDVLQTITLKVKGMMCAHCEARVAKACLENEHVLDAVANHETGTVTLKTDGDVDIEKIKTDIKNVGYEVIK